MKNQIIVYNLILNYSIKELVNGGMYFCKLNYKGLKKESDKLIQGMQKKLSTLQKVSLKDTIMTIHKNAQDIEKISHEMLTIIAIDWLVNIERDKTARVKFSHLPLTKILDEMQNRFKEDMIKHYKFFEGIVKAID